MYPMARISRSFRRCYGAICWYTVWMSSSRPTATRVLRLRVKDKHASWLSGFERERRFLSGFDFWPFLKGVTRGDCALHLPVQAVQEIAEEYARRRRQHRKVRLAWRKSGGARRSLGWIPFKVRTIRYLGGQIYFAGRWLSLWDSYGLKRRTACGQFQRRQPRTL